jgi:hypothetical protein
MSIIGGIIQIVVLLLPVILAAIAARNTPEAKLSDQNENIDKAIAKGDAAAVTNLANDMLGKLRDTNSGDSQ